MKRRTVYVVPLVCAGDASSKNTPIREKSMPKHTQELLNIEILVHILTINVLAQHANKINV